MNEKKKKKKKTETDIFRDLFKVIYTSNLIKTNKIAWYMYVFLKTNFCFENTIYLARYHEGH